jgi:hypothetical protein
VILTEYCILLNRTAKVAFVDRQGDIMDEPNRLDWHSEFSDEQLAAIRSAIPTAIHDSQERSARAHTEYADPDGDQDVYGVGMSRGAQKELQAALKSVDGYREQRVEGTRRSLTYVDNTLIFLQRVGKKMPRNHRRVRLSYLPEQRRELLEKTSNVKYTDPGLFDLPEEEPDQTANLSDVLDLVGNSGRVTLFVPYYSSTPFAVGSMFWAPARLRGHHLEFTDPERLSYAKEPAAMETKREAPRATGGFAEGNRPRTSAKLRPRPEDEKGHK